jgi:alpha-L-fucosidase
MQERLLQIGEWLKVNGDAIYGSKAGPFWPRRFPWGVCTYKPGRIFVILHGRQGATVTLPGLTNKVAAAYLLADKDKKPLTVAKDAAGLTLTLPERLPDEAASVIVVEIEGEPAVEKSRISPQS